MRARLAVALVTMAMVLAGCSLPDTHWVGAGTPSAGASGRPGSGLAWHDCADHARRLLGLVPPTMTYECASLPVPQDWATARDGKSSDGRTFNLALLRVRSTRQTDRIGSVVINPGGPGGSGVDYAVYLSALIPKVAQRFDIVGFDPRGVGQSSPVKCISDANLDATFGYEPDPVSRSDFNGYVTLARDIAEACDHKYGDSLRLYSTEQAAHDINAIRAALGDTKLTYLGFSYGTLLGAVYAELFPTSIRAMVLDGAVDPRQQPVAATEAQASGFEHAFSDFADWCLQDAGHCPIGPDARGSVANLMRTARTTPVKGSDGRSATAGWVLYGIVSSLYSQDTWPLLAQALAALRQGNADKILSLADRYTERDRNGHYSNLFDANSAISCADSDHYPTVEQIRTLQNQWRDKYPLFGATLAMSLVTCAVWPVKADPYPVGPATGAPPIVVIGTTGDPATPYGQTAKLAGMLGVGRIVTWDGEGHTAYPQTSCIRSAVDNYLIGLAAPATGLTCPAQ